MRQRYLLLIATIFAPHFYAPASADEPVAPEPTRIEANTESSRIDFYIDDRLMAVLKDDGLHVREGINYGGMLTDYGTAHFDKSFANDPSENAAEGGDYE